MKKVIITGATGFIGFNVLNELYSNGIRIIAVVRENSKNLWKLKDLDIDIIECNLCSFDTLTDKIADRDIDAVYHFAWQGVSDSDLKNETVQLNNTAATLKLIDAAHKLGIRKFIGAGSLHEAEAIEELSEDRDIQNLGIMYKSAKIAAHYMGKAKAGAYGIEFFWPVVTNTYGQGEKSGRLINTVIRKILNGQIPDLSEGKQLYDFVHINDTARAFRLIGERGVSGVNYVIGSGTPGPLRNYLETVGRIANSRRGGKQIEPGFGNIKSNVIFLPEKAFDTSSLVRDTGFCPSILFEDGIAETVEWIWRDMML